MAYSRRVNLRLEDDVFLAYEKVARFLNLTPTDLVRDAVMQGVSAMETLGEMIDRAKAGDKEAASNLFSAFLDIQQGKVNLGRSLFAPEASTTAEVAHEE
jgi:hypothetical protein